MRKNNFQQKEEKIQYSNGTVFNAFVYLKFKDDFGSQPKKIKYPNSVQSLLNLAKKMFNDVVDVQSLFTKNGKRIQYIDDVVPGDLCFFNARKWL